jgi:hypothetical protein
MPEIKLTRRGRRALKAGLDMSADNALCLEVMNKIGGRGDLENMCDMPGAFPANRLLGRPLVSPGISRYYPMISTLMSRGQPVPVTAGKHMGIRACRCCPARTSSRLRAARPQRNHRPRASFSWVSYGQRWNYSRIDDLLTAAWPREIQWGLQGPTVPPPLTSRDKAQLLKILLGKFRP